MLNHVRTGTEARHYNRYDYLAEKREALESWAEHVQAVAKRYALPLTEQEVRSEKIRAAILASYPDPRSEEEAIQPLIDPLTDRASA